MLVALTVPAEESCRFNARKVAVVTLVRLLVDGKTASQIATSQANNEPGG